MKHWRIGKAAALAYAILIGCMLTGCGESAVLELDTSEVQQYYLAGEAFSTDGLEIYAVSDTGEKEPVPVSKCKVTAPDMNTRGEQPVKITYRGGEASYQITVAKAQKQKDKTAILFDGHLSVDAYLVGQGRPFVIVLPGGGYGMVSDGIEGKPVAEAINELGYNAFVVQYGTGKNGQYPQPQDDVAQAVAMILANADHFEISPDNWAIMGFSAGGHLAASWCTKAAGYAQYGLPSPSAAILCYPVITMGEQGHDYSRSMHLGEEPDPAQIERLSVEKQIDADYPAVFLWVGTADQEVDTANSRMLDEALTANHVVHEFTEYEDVTHGVGLAKGTAAQNWLSDAISFWQAQ